jgi:hypothetical protein
MSFTAKAAKSAKDENELSRSIFLCALCGEIFGLKE